MYRKSKIITIKTTIFGFFSEKMVLCDSHRPLVLANQAIYTMCIKYI